MEHLETPFRRRQVAGYQLLMGFDDPVLTGAMVAELRALEGAYRERFRLTPVGEAAETVVIFDSEERYRSFQETVPRLSGLRSAGHSTRGLVALYRGDRTLQDVTETLRHEIAHLLNGRSLGPALPPWLEEGTADELALLGRLGGDDAYAAHRFRLGDRTLYRGPLAGLRQLIERQASGRWIPLHEVLAMDWDQFVRHPDSGVLYVQSAFFMHWLLSGERRTATHRFLNAVSLGRPPTAAELSRAHGHGIDELDRDFQEWLASQRDEAR